MKIIHTGDIHIGSAFVGLPKDKAARRKAELLDNFRLLCAYAKDNDVKAVLIAGDLFDENDVSAQVKNEVLSLIEGAAPVDFFYVLGNHDANVRLHENSPENFHTFSHAHGFLSYHLGENVTVTGADARHFEQAFSAPLSLCGEHYNVLLLHGTICENQPKNKDDIPLSYFRNQNVDYLALGHIHKPMPLAERLDFRGKYRYCGCLEGRGFDEVGERGFFLLEIQNGKLTDEKFLSFAKRKIVEQRVDISACKTHFDVERAVETGVTNIPREHVVKIVLCGRYKEGLRKDLPMLYSLLNDRFFFAKIEDESRLFIDYKSFENDVTERGEFVREACRYEMNEDFRAEVLEIGLAALSGEEIEL